MSLRFACIGGCAIDRKFRAVGDLSFGTSNPVRSERRFGGVARNVAENLARLGATVSFVSMVGEDEAGRGLIAQLSSLGVNCNGVGAIPGRATAEYAAVLDARNDLAIGLADMDVFESMTPEWLDISHDALATCGWVFADCNLPAATLAALIERQRKSQFKLAIDAVSTAKALRLPTDLSGVDLLFANRSEGDAILRRAGARASSIEEAALALCATGAAQCVVTDGARGLAVAKGGRAENCAGAPADVLDVTGAGDALIAAALFALGRHHDLIDAARFGAMLAARTIETADTVWTQLSPVFAENFLTRRGDAPQVTA